MGEIGLSGIEAETVALRRRIRETAIAWVRLLPPSDAVMAIHLHNKRWPAVELHLDHAEHVHGVSPDRLAKLIAQAERASFDSGRYATAILDGEPVEFVLDRFERDHPGLSREACRMAIAYGYALVSSGRERARERRAERIEAARRATLLDGVFLLQHFNRHWGARPWYGGHSQGIGDDPIFETLSDLHSTEAIEDAIARVDRLIVDGRRVDFSRSHEIQIEELSQRNPGFGRESLGWAANWGAQANR